MSATPTNPLPDAVPRRSAFRRVVERIGGGVIYALSYLGGVAWLTLDTLAWTWRSAVRRQVRFGRPAFYSQIVRLGIHSVGIVALVSCCIGLILAFQMAPPLQQFGQVDKVANIIAIAVFRELGPLISAVVLTGFAGASIAAELGTMVVGEEIEALQAHALNPIRFLVVPRILATVIALLVVCIIGEWVSILSGMTIGSLMLEIPYEVYKSNTINQLDYSDVLTGLFKAGIFGLIIGSIACYNGLSVEGGAAGVGKATTNTVVHSIVSIIFTDMIFTAVFYKLGWT